MSFESNLENINSYSLFGPSKPKNHGLLMIAPHLPTPFTTDSVNLIQPPMKMPETSVSSMNVNQPSNTSISNQTACDRKKLFVGNLPSNTSLDELVDLFGKYGRVNKNLSVVKDDNYAFIHYYNELDAEQAHKELNDSFFKNRYIRVQYSVSQGHIKKQPKLFSDLKPPKFASTQLLSNSSSYSSICSSNDNFAMPVHLPQTSFKLSQSQSVMSFNSFQTSNTAATSTTIGRAIKKSNSINKNSSNSSSFLSTSPSTSFIRPISASSMPISQSFDHLSLLQNTNNSISNDLTNFNFNISSYIYVRSLLEQQQKLQQLQQLQSRIQQQQQQQHEQQQLKLQQNQQTNNSNQI